MARNTDTALQELQAVSNTLSNYGPFLSALLDDIDRGTCNIPRSWATKLDNTIYKHNQRLNIIPRLLSKEQDLQHHSNKYQDKLRASENTIRELTNSVTEARQRLSDLQIQVAAFQNEVLEQEQTIRALRAELRGTGRQGTMVCEATATSPTHVNPNTAGGQGSTSGDSGLPEASTSTGLGERTRQRVAEASFRIAITDFNRSDFRQAAASFTDVQTIISQLPNTLRYTFDTTKLAYYRAVCQAETGPNPAAHTTLATFLQTHTQAPAIQKAHIEHLLARTSVKLGRPEDAFTHSCTAVGVWHDIDRTHESYLDAAALLARIHTLRGEPVSAAAVVAQPMSAG